MTVRYVSTTGSDSTGDGSLLSPWRTVQKWVGTPGSHPAPGDTLYIRGGTYAYTDGAWTARDTWGSLVGTALNPITISAYPGETPNFANAASEVLAFGPNETSNTDGTAWVIVDGLRFTNAAAADESVISIGGFEETYRLVHDIVIRNCYFSMAGTASPTDNHIGIIHNASNITIEDCEFVGAGVAGVGGDGIVLYSTPAPIGTVVRRCVFKEFDNRVALQVWDYNETTPIADISITHCTFLNNSAYGIDLRYHSTALVRDNAYDVSAGSAFYDPYDFADTTHDHDYYSQSFNADYSPVTGATCIGGASDGTDAGARPHRQSRGVAVL